MMDLFKKISALLQGKKMYLVCLVGIIESLIQFTVDGDLWGCINKIMLALAGMAGKSAVSKLEPK